MQLLIEINFIELTQQWAGRVVERRNLKIRKDFQQGLKISFVFASTTHLRLATFCPHPNPTRTHALN